MKLRAAMILLLSFTQSAAAGTGNVVQLPARGVKSVSGVKVTLDTTWAQGSGYRPVRIELTNWPLGPTMADRSFRIELSPNSWGGRLGTVTVSAFVEMPEGAASVSATIAVPQTEAWGSVWLEVYEDGQRLNDVSSSMNTATFGGYQWEERAPAILIIDSDAPSRANRGTPSGKVTSAIKPKPKSHRAKRCIK